MDPLQTAPSASTDIVVPAPDDGGLAAAAAAFNAEMEAEFAAASDADLDAELGVDGSTTPPPASAAPPVEVPPPPPPAEDPAVARGLEKLVAREVEIARREAQVTEFERLRPAYERELQSLRQQVSGLQGLREQLQSDPEAAIRALGGDPDVAVKLVLAGRMGEKAPPELRQALQEAKRDREIRELREQLQRQDQARAQADYWSQVGSGLDQFLGGDLVQTAPTVAALRAVDPARARAETLAEIQRDAHERLARGEDPSAPILSYEEAAKRLEARYSWARAQPTSAPTVPPAPPAVAQPAASKQVPSTSAGNGSAVAVKQPAGTTPAPKAPRPLMPWKSQSTSELEEAGIREALAEYRRLQPR
jgi:hypothetical protein